MKSRIFEIGSFALAIAAALTSAGCSQAPAEVSASAGAAPVVTVPVGPLPGVTVQPPLPGNPLANNPVALEEGRMLFVKYNCSGCHGGHGGGGMGPSLRDPVWIYGGEDAHVFESIAQGRANGMPSWGARVPQEEIWQLVAYIKSMRTPQEPEKPE
jgi:cytochrome c oxidase cbb3-type subunit 3